MTFHEFENEIRETLAKYIREKALIERYTELLLGLVEESAEVTQIIRKTIPGNFHETEIDLPHLEEEIGDVIWYITHMAMQLPSTNLNNIATANLQKTSKSYSSEEQLTFTQYQQKVNETYKEDLPKTKEERARFFAMGMLKEIGEISELFGGHRIDRITLDINKAEEKFGDTLWYLAAISDNYGLDLEAIARKNIQKTKARYNKNGIAQIPKIEEGR